MRHHLISARCRCAFKAQLYLCKRMGDWGLLSRAGGRKRRGVVLKISFASFAPPWRAWATTFLTGPLPPGASGETREIQRAIGESRRATRPGCQCRSLVLICLLFRGNKRPLSKDELGGKDTEPLGSFCIQGMSGFLYLADDSPLSTLVTASQLCSRRLAARDVRG